MTDETDNSKDDALDIEQMLELAALQQKFSEPDDELTQVLQDCTRALSEAPDEGASTPADKPAAQCAPHQLPVGTVLDGHYVIDGVLGQGGFGITYAGRDTVLDARVAIKEFYPHGYVTRDAGYSTAVAVASEKNAGFVAKGREKFLQEARTLAKFQDQPGIVDVKTYFEENDTAYIVMEYLEGVDLRCYLAHNLPFEAADIFERLTPVMDALEQIHEQGMLHRDVSPDNIMMRSDGSLTLMDFGAARAVDAEAPQTMSLVLKPGYAPEEQYLPKSNQGPWTDIYALCATAYKCITGATPPDALRRGAGDADEWPSEMGFKIAPQLEAVLKTGMALDPQERFQSIAEMRRALAGEAPAVTAPAFRQNARACDDDVDADAVTQPQTKEIPAGKSRMGSGRMPRSRKLAVAVVAIVLAVLVGVAVATFAFAQPRLSATSIAVVKGAEAQVVLEHGTDDTEWRVDDKRIVEVSAHGASVSIAARRAGAVTLMAVCDGRLYECHVTVDDPELSREKVTLGKGDSIVLELLGTECEVEWSSSDGGVAEISMVDGTKATITGKKAGRATIKATVCGVSFKCAVTVGVSSAGKTGARAGTGPSASQTTGGSSSGSGKTSSADDATTAQEKSADNGESSASEGEQTSPGSDEGSGQAETESGSTSQSTAGESSGGASGAQVQQADPQTDSSAQ